MRIMGLTVTLNWISWFIVAYLLYFIPTVVVVCVMKWCMCPASNFLVLMLIFIVFILTLVCFTFMITAFVTSTLMSMTALFLMQFISFLPYLIIGIQHKNIQTLVVCMFMNSAMPSMFSQIYSYELRGVGLQWSNIFKHSHPDDQVSIGTILMIMLFTNILRILVAIYVDQLNPGDFGVAKKWYFPCQRTFWCPWKRPERRFVDEEQPLQQSMSSRAQLNESDLMRHKNVIIEAHNLSKTYGEHEVVHDFSLKFYENELTMLIGHNGSGKTTTFMMLAGVLAPTSGNISINGIDMAEAIQKGQRSFSICPQYNILFDELSAYWHLVFYSRLKGYERDAAEAEAERYLTVMDLLDKATIRVEYLTTSMRRKLSVCCALCGNTKVSANRNDPQLYRSLYTPGGGMR